MESFINEDGSFNENKSTALPELLGDDYYNDPKTKQEPTKAFDNINNVGDLFKMALHGTRKISEGEKAFAERIKGMVKVPGDGATEEEVKAYRQAIGVPETMGGYELTIPEGDDKAAFTSIAEAVKEASLAAGVPKLVLGPVWNRVVETITNQNKILEAKGLERMEADKKALEEKYKEKYPKFVEICNKVLAKLKTGPDAIKILDTFGITDYPAIKEMLFEIAPLVLPDEFKGGTDSGKTGGGWFTDYKYD